MKKVCIWGLGRIGLPIAVVLKAAGYDVVGVDQDEKHLSSIIEGNISCYEPKISELLKKYPFPVQKTGLPADIHLIAVPTPLKKPKQIDLSAVHQVVSSLAPILKKNDLVIIESTCSVGTTQSIAKQLSSAFVAYCPERILPGHLYYELIHNDRIVGGINEKSTHLAAVFYRSFIKGKVVKTNARTAEMTKLAENAFRDVNLAFANELSMLVDNLDINVDEVIHLANHHPRVNILKPGPGVGGHCIAIDPYFLAAANPKMSHLISCARLVNKKKQKWVLEKILHTVETENVKLVVCLGLTYKPNVNDTRESPALQIVRALKKKIDVQAFDPFINGCEHLEKALKKADLIIGLVAHEAFKTIPKKWLKAKLCLDFSGVFK